MTEWMNESTLRVIWWFLHRFSPTILHLSLSLSRRLWGKSSCKGVSRLNSSLIRVVQLRCLGRAADVPWISLRTIWLLMALRMPGYTRVHVQVCVCVCGCDCPLALDSDIPQTGSATSHLSDELSLSLALCLAVMLSALRLPPWDQPRTHFLKWRQKVVSVPFKRAGNLWPVWGI